MPHELLSFYLSDLVGNYVASLSDYSLELPLAAVLLYLIPQVVLILLLALGQPFLLEQLLLEVSDPVDNCLFFLDGFDPVGAGVVRWILKGQGIHHGRVLRTLVGIQWLTVGDRLLLGQDSFRWLRRVVELLIKRLVVGAAIHILLNLLLKLQLHQSVELSHGNMLVLHTACIHLPDVAITSLTQDPSPSMLLFLLNYQVLHFYLTFGAFHNFKANGWLLFFRLC